VGTDCSTGTEAFCKATKVVCELLTPNQCVNDEDCPDPDPIDTPDTPTIDAPEFDIYTNGRINGCDLELDYATVSGPFGTVDALNVIGPKNNPGCGIESHYVAAVFYKVATVSGCDLLDVCLETGPCEPGNPGDGGCGDNGACSWTCPSLGFGNFVRIYAIPKGSCSGFCDPGPFTCYTFGIAGGGSACFSDVISEVC